MHLGWLSGLWPGEAQKPQGGQGGQVTHSGHCLNKCLLGSPATFHGLVKVGLWTLSLFLSLFRVVIGKS